MAQKVFHERMWFRVDKASSRVVRVDWAVVSPEEARWKLCRSSRASAVREATLVGEVVAFIFRMMRLTSRLSEGHEAGQVWRRGR